MYIPNSPCCIIPFANTINDDVDNNTNDGANNITKDGIDSTNYNIINIITTGYKFNSFYRFNAHA